MQSQKKLKPVIAPIVLSVLAFLAANFSVAGDAPALKTKNLILVHGAWADGSSWSKVIALLQRRGFHATAVQLSLTSVADDVATLKRALELETGPVLLVGHSYAGVVITEAGNDPKVIGLVYIAAYAPDTEQTVFFLNTLAPPAPINQEIILNAGFLSLTEKGVSTDFAPDLPESEKQILAATQGPVAATAFDTAVKSPAWHRKPSWYMVASEDRVISPQLEAMMAQTISAETITVRSSHVIMLSKPEAVADFIEHAAHGRD